MTSTSTPPTGSTGPQNRQQPSNAGAVMPREPSGTRGPNQQPSGRTEGPRAPFRAVLARLSNQTGREGAWATRLGDGSRPTKPGPASVAESGEPWYRPTRDARADRQRDRGAEALELVHHPALVAPPNAGVSGISAPGAPSIGGSAVHAAEVAALAERILTSFQIGGREKGHRMVRMVLRTTDQRGVAVELHHRGGVLDAQISPDAGGEMAAERIRDALVAGLASRGVSIGSIDIA